MSWTKRLLLALPFVIAAVLNALMLAVDRLHLRREHIAGYGFLFATPWAWLLDRGWFPHIHNRWLLALVGYAVILFVAPVNAKTKNKPRLIVHLKVGGPVKARQSL